MKNLLVSFLKVLFGSERLGLRAIITFGFSANQNDCTFLHILSYLKYFAVSYV